MGKIIDMLNEMPDLFDGTGVFEAPEFAEAVIGYTDDGRLIYDYDKMVLSYMAEALDKPYDKIVEDNEYWLENSSDTETDDTITKWEDFEQAMQDAREWIDYNTIRTIPYMGPKAPIIMYKAPLFE